MYEAATGLLGWSPHCFWRSTYWEYSHALVGHMKYHGKGKWNPDSSQAIRHWNDRDYQKAKKEIAVSNAVREPATQAPKDWQLEMKERRKRARAKHGK